ncbi:MAG: helix-turn-helix transcriptional regulator [Clostridia bacterium]|nr:helix-turn-helix transcriptional regulator [Clostridia bacterium]
MIDIVKSNELCLSDFGVQKVLTREFMSYDAGKGKKESNFGFMMQGNGVFSSVFGNLEVNAGDLIYIPEGARYRSLSKGSPFVEYYCIHVSFRNDPAAGRVDRRFGMQKIDALSTPETGALFSEMYKLVRDSSMESRARALQLFYGFFAEAAKHLKEAERAACSPCVDHALAYIEEHFCEDYSMAELAKECLVSESQLYHLFKRELHTTPVEYKNEMKILASIEHLKEGVLTVEEISFRLGFHSSSYFRRMFKSATGMTPKEFRRKHVAQ